MHLDRIKTEQQIFAKLSGSAGGSKVGVGGGDYAHVDTARVGGADPLNLAGLEHAQQLRLLMHGHVADLVQEDGSTVGQFEASDTIAAGICKSAFHVPEE